MKPDQASLLEEESIRFQAFRLLWGLVGFLGLLALMSAGSLAKAEGSLRARPFCFAGMLLAVAVAGWFCRWGPLIPCVLMGIVAVGTLVPAWPQNYEEFIGYHFGLLLLGAALGFAIAIALEHLLRGDSPPPEAKQPGSE